MQGQRPILEGVRGCVMLDCDLACDVLCEELLPSKLATISIYFYLERTTPRTYRLLQGGILLLGAYGFITINYCEFCTLILLPYAGWRSRLRFQLR